MDKSSASSFLSRFFARLNESGIKYCVMKNYDQLPSYISNDVDMWVEDGLQGQFRDILLSIGQDDSWKMIAHVPRLKYKGEGNYFFVNQDMSEIVHIDLWCYFNRRGVRYLNDSIFKDNLSLHENGFYIPSPGLEASILLFKDLIYQGKILEKYRKKITSLVHKDPTVFAKSVKATFSNIISSFIIDAVTNAKWDELEKSYRILRRDLFRKILFERYLSYCFDVWSYLVDRSKKYLFPKTGIFLVLLGPDGSGKSTIAENVMNSEVIKKLFMKKSYFHSRFQFLPPLRKFLPFYKQTETVQTPENHQSRTYGMFRSMVYPIYYGLSYFLGHPLLWKQKACAGLVVFDRYFYDFLIQREVMKCPKWIIRGISKLIPKPDIIVFLQTEPEIIYKRKQELTIEEIERQNKLCTEFTAGFSNAVSVDASLSVDQIVDQIQKVIIEKVKEKQKI